MRGRNQLILGLNQYTHSAACCLLGPDGEVLYAQAKERLTRKKFDGGDTAELLRYALAAVGAKRANIGLVVANNHLFRIRPFEQTLDWATALHQHPPTSLDDHNLLPGVPKHELSHHLAHAWSVLPVAPFDEGLIVVMDGIGNTLRDVKTRAEGFTSDEDLRKRKGFVQVPEKPDPAWGWREAETVYTFRQMKMQRVFKRYSRENTPVFLYNYGFENMDSLGALYSRISSHIFGDWNACGKVMGLAPWDAKWSRGRREEGEWIMKGPLGRLKVNWPLLRTEPYANEWSVKRHRKRYARLAGLLQENLEEVVLPFLRRLRRETGARNLCLVGGVALNSTLNGRIVRETGFEQVFIPSYPGDEGIAVGCALFGHHALKKPTERPARQPLSPFLGRAFSPAEIDAALAEQSAFLEWRASENPAADAADALAAEQVVAWFQGRSEFGPRALGNRSLLAHPKPRRMVERLNLEIKKREAFRPFAPTVLAERAAEFFEGAAASPFMSLTAPVSAAKRRRIAAVVHVDGSARLQTLCREENPRFYELISAFAERTGLPLVLNTSFNLQGEPIVESPADALRAFLEGGIDLLVMEDRVVTRRPFPAPEELPGQRPLHRSDLKVEVSSDAAGEPQQVVVLAEGLLRETDPLTLGVLEACTGEATVAEIQADFADSFEVQPDEVLARLRTLYAWRLLGFQNGGGA